jgi:hypothetical protein
MESDDVVDPGDAALQELLACMAEHSRDAELRDTYLDYVMTVPPLAEWPAESLDGLMETGRYLISLGRLSREFRKLTERDEQ